MGPQLAGNEGCSLLKSLGDAAKKLAGVSPAVLPYKARTGTGRLRSEQTVHPIDRETLKGVSGLGKQERRAAKASADRPETDQARSQSNSTKSGSETEDLTQPSGPMAEGRGRVRRAHPLYV